MSVDLLRSVPSGAFRGRPELPFTAIMIVDEIHRWATWLMIVLAPLTFIMLMTIVAPYGRYSKSGWGPLINPRLAWMLWELPSLLIPLMMACTASNFASLLENPLSKRTVLLTCFLAHYTYRSIAFPLIMHNGKPAPLSVMLSGWAFCVWNGFLQGWFILHQLPHNSSIGLAEVVGVLIWMFGWINVMRADYTLINLRKPGETGYKIPRGGLFEYVSAANYASEILEWTGYSIAAGALPGLAFALFTFCNIGPRGHSHHKWYQEKFKDYPKSRKAVIPFIW